VHEASSGPLSVLWPSVVRGPAVREDHGTDLDDVTDVRASAVGALDHHSGATVVRKLDHLGFGCWFLGILLQRCWLPRLARGRGKAGRCRDMAQVGVRVLAQRMGDLLRWENDRLLRLRGVPGPGLLSLGISGPGLLSLRIPGGLLRW